MLIVRGEIRDRCLVFSCAPKTFSKRMVFGLCFCVCTVAMSSTLYYVEDAAIVSNKLAIVIQRSSKTYHQTLGDKIFGDIGRLIEEVNAFFYCSTTSEWSTNCAPVFERPVSLLTVGGSENASLSFTSQRNIISYRLPLEIRVGLLDIKKQSNSIVESRDGLSRTMCSSPDGLLVWQEAASLWVYDLLKTNMVKVGKTPLLATTDEWCVGSHPHFLNAFYATGNIFQWRDGEGVIRKYSTETGALIGTITNGESIVHSVKQDNGQVYSVFVGQQGGIRVFNGNGQLLSTFYGCDELPGSYHHVLYEAKKKILLIVNKDIHPKNRCVTVRLLDCDQKRMVIQKIKIPSSL
jgi:hypothetical protein